jgi:hypothetical protein
MNTGRHRQSSESEVKSFAIDYAYDTYPELKQQAIKISVQDCSAIRVTYRQRIVGPGEAIDMILSDEVWEVIIPLKVFSVRLKIRVRRNNDGSLEITDDPQLLPWN